MPEGETGGKGMSGFLNRDTAGLPNWAWLLVIVAGIGAAYLLPKFFGGNKSAASGTDASNQSQPQGTTGLGLAIDPTTGLPYAVEGLVPSGGTVGTQPGTLPPVPTTAPPPVTTPPVTLPPPVEKPPKKRHIPVDFPVGSDNDNGRQPHTLPPVILPPLSRKVGSTVTWPQQDTLDTVARRRGVSVERLQQQNGNQPPYISIEEGTQILV